MRGSEGQLGPKSSSGSGRISTQALLQGGVALEKWTQMCGNLFSIVRFMFLTALHSYMYCIRDMQGLLRSLFLQPPLCWWITLITMSLLLWLSISLNPWNTDVKEAIPIDWCHPATRQHLVVFMALSSEVVRWPERLADGRLLKDVADEANTQAEWKWGRWQHIFPDD